MRVSFTTYVLYLQMHSLQSLAFKISQYIADVTRRHVHSLSQIKKCHIVLLCVHVYEKVHMGTSACTYAYCRNDMLSVFTPKERAELDNDIIRRPRELIKKCDNFQTFNTKYFKK